VKSGFEHESTMAEEWDAWIEAHAPGLLLYARQQCRTEADAQDVLQDAIVECWRNQPEAQPPRPARVYATVRLRAIDLARQPPVELNAKTQPARIRMPAGLIPRRRTVSAPGCCRKPCEN
jgi:DNA-directed RNA polymerase specialized sigma24 family protein